jgi:polyisoprenoid-binding protein YceI
MTRSGTIIFHAGTTVEDIDGTNKEVASILNTKTGEIAFSVPVKSFRFTRSLMEEHFNENYMESNKYPKATFQGKISDLSGVNFTKDGAYKMMVEGDLMIHGVTKKITAPASITVSQGKIAASSSFKVPLADYNVVIPGVVADKISKDASIEVTCTYEVKK